MNKRFSFFKKEKKSQTRKLVFRTTLAAFINFLLVLILVFAGIFDFLENKSFDYRTVKTADFVKPSQDIIFIAVDQESLDFAAQEYGWAWPWPRTAYANIVDFISAGNVNSIAFDILFTEGSVYGPEDDKNFATASFNSKKVIQTMFISGAEDNKTCLYPIPQIKESAALLGNTTSSLDKDHIIRSAKLFYNIEDKNVPTLGIAPLVLQNENIKKLPVQKDGSVILRYQKSIDKYTIYFASDLLKSFEAWQKGEEGIFSPSDFDNAYVYFALFAPGLFDICSTPVSKVFPGVGVHITQLDNYLNNSYIKKVPAFISVLWLFITGIAAALIISAGTKKRSQTKSTLFLTFGFIAGTVICISLPFILFIPGIWLPFVAPLYLFISTFLINLIIVLSMEGKQKRFIKTAFSQCLSKDIVNQIINDPESFNLGGNKVIMTALFTDIRKFSSLSEFLSVPQLEAILNHYLTKMTDLIIEQKGTIDKYEGDAIIAMFGAPVTYKDHAINACKAALEIKKAEIQLNKEIDSANLSTPQSNLDSALKTLKDNNYHFFTRIGINSGEMIAGFFGSQRRKSYTMMGNNVNLASRLEGINKQYSTQGIIISENTMQLLDNKFIVRKLDKIIAVNMTIPLRIYELIEEKEKASENQIDYYKKWDEAINLFDSKSYEDSLKLFKELKAENQEDKVCEYYINLLSRFFTKGIYPSEQHNAGVAFIPETSAFKLLQK